MKTTGVPVISGLKNAGLVPRRVVSLKRSTASALAVPFKVRAEKSQSDVLF